MSNDGIPITSKMLPSLPSHKRHCPECVQFTFPLSAFTKQIGTKNGYPVYKKTTKWKCLNMHITTTEMRVDMDGKKL